MVGEALWLRPGIFTVLLGDSCMGLKLHVGKKKKKKKWCECSSIPSTAIHTLSWQKNSVHSFQRKLSVLSVPLFLRSQRNIKWTKAFKIPSFPGLLTHSPTINLTWQFWSSLILPLCHVESHRIRNELMGTEYMDG